MSARKVIALKEYIRQFLKSKVYIFGLTRNGILLAHYLRMNTDVMICFVDNDAHKRVQPFFMNTPCVSVREIESKARIIISNKSEDDSKSIYNQLIQAGNYDIVYLDHNVIEKYAMSMNDAEYLKCIWYYKMGYELDLDCPKTFNEKLQWLKLKDHDPEYTRMVDKYEVKKYVSEAIGAEYVIPTIGIWDSVDDINFSELPDRFVLKCTHDSGSVVLCRDIDSFDVATAKKRLETACLTNYFYQCREWPYKNVKPRIMAEQLLENEKNSSLVVYKFLCFDGKPKIVQVIQNDKQVEESIDYFDIEWNLLDLRQNFPNSKYHLPKPVSFDHMLELVKILSSKKRFIRVDFYEIDCRPYFSEFTFYSDAGFEKFVPNNWDLTLGEWINL